MKKTLLICATVFSCLFTACSNNDVLPENMTTRLASGEYIRDYDIETQCWVQRKLVFNPLKSYCVVKAEYRDQFLANMESAGLDVSQFEESIYEGYRNDAVPEPFTNCVQFYNVAYNYEALNKMDAVVYAGPYFSAENDLEADDALTSCVIATPKEGQLVKIKEFINEFDAVLLGVDDDAYLKTTYVYMALSKWSKCNPMEFTNTLCENGIYAQVFLRVKF